VFILGKPFHCWLLFAGNATSRPKSRAPEKCFTRVGCSLTHKHYTTLEKLAKDKHISLLREFIITDVKSFITLTPGANVIKNCPWFTYFCAKLECYLVQTGKVYQWQMLYLIMKIHNYGCKKLYEIGPRAQCYKSFFVCDLRIFLIS
jgi:hypothetical protein